MIKLLLQYPTLQLSAIDKMVFCFEIFINLLREKISCDEEFFCKVQAELLQNTHLYEQ